MFFIFYFLLQNWVCPDRSLLFFFRLPQFFVVHHLSSTNVHGFIAHLFWLDRVFMGIQGYTPRCHPHQGSRALLGDYSGTMMLNTPWTRPYFRGDTLMYSHYRLKVPCCGDIMCRFKFPSKISRQHFNTTNLVTNQALAGWCFWLFNGQSSFLRKSQHTLGAYPRNP